MSLRQPDNAYRKILANPRNSQKLRLAALKAMARPSITFLANLEADPATPDKLRFAIAQRREAETLILRRLNAEPNSNPRTDRQ